VSDPRSLIALTEADVFAANVAAAEEALLCRICRCGETESGIQLRESQLRIILILNSSIKKQKDESQLAFLSKPALGFLWTAELRQGVRRLRPIITQIGSKPKFSKQGSVTLEHEGGALFY
jgi:hypothetical protein